MCLISDSSVGRAGDCSCYSTDISRSLVRIRVGGSFWFVVSVDGWMLLKDTRRDETLPLLLFEVPDPAKMICSRRVSIPRPSAHKTDALPTAPQERPWSSLRACEPAFPIRNVYGV